MGRCTCALGALTILSLAACLALPGAVEPARTAAAAQDDAPRRLPEPPKKRTELRTAARPPRPASQTAHLELGERPANPPGSARSAARPATVDTPVRRVPPVSEGYSSGFRIAALPVAPDRVRQDLADDTVTPLYDVPLPLDLSHVLAAFEEEVQQSDEFDDGPWLTAPETALGTAEDGLEEIRMREAAGDLADAHADPGRLQADPIRPRGTVRSLRESAVVENPEAPRVPSSAAWIAEPPPSDRTGEETVPSSPAEGREFPAAAAVVVDPIPIVHAVDWQQDGQLAAVAAQVDALLDRGFALAEKGALYSARSEFFQALQVVGRSLDARIGRAGYTRALNEGLVALREAQDFSGSGSPARADVDVAAVIARHRTGVCKQQAANLTSVAAMQHYFAYAEERLTLACGGSPAASRACYGLGKVYAALAEQSPTEKLNSPRAMIFHQIATRVDPANYRAANELGVLLARFGQLPEARRALQQSVVVHPLPETWHNLMVVHQRLGEHDLAQRARNELALAQQSQSAGSLNAGMPAQPVVQWVDPSTFAQNAGYDPQAGPPRMAAPQRAATDGNRPWIR